MLISMLRRQTMINKIKKDVKFLFIYWDDLCIFMPIMLNHKDISPKKKDFKNNFQGVFT